PTAHVASIDGWSSAARGKALPCTGKARPCTDEPQPWTALVRTVHGRDTAARGSRDSRAWLRRGRAAIRLPVRGGAHGRAWQRPKPCTATASSVPGTAGRRGSLGVVRLAHEGAVVHPAVAVVAHRHPVPALVLGLAPVGARGHVPPVVAPLPRRRIA